MKRDRASRHSLHEINDLKATEDELNRTIVRNKLAQTASNTGTWDWCLADGSIVWSDNVEAMLGIAQGKMEHTFEALLQHVYP